MSKLIEIQRELIVVKSQLNAFGGYYYRSSEDILMALKPLLIKHECTLTVSDKIHNLSEHIYIESVASITYKENNEYKTFTASSFARDGITQKGMNSAQVTNSASSFAKKQALSNLFLIDDSTDVPPTADEQIEAEIEIKEQKEKTELEQREKIESFLDESSINIDKAETLDELQKIFGMTYREAQKINEDVVNKVTEYYNERKGKIK